METLHIKIDFGAHWKRPQDFPEIIKGLAELVQWGVLPVPRTGNQGPQFSFKVLPKKSAPTQIILLTVTIAGQSVTLILKRYDLYLIGYDLGKRRRLLRNHETNLQGEDIGFGTGYAELEKFAKCGRQFIELDKPALAEAIGGLHQLHTSRKQFSKDPMEALCLLTLTQMLPESVRFPHLSYFCSNVIRIGGPPPNRAWITGLESDFKKLSKRVYKCTDPDYALQKDYSAYGGHQVNPYDGVTNQVVPYYRKMYPPTFLDTREKLFDTLGILLNQDHDNGVAKKHKAIPIGEEKPQSSKWARKLSILGMKKSNTPEFPAWGTTRCQAIQILSGAQFYDLHEGLAKKIPETILRGIGMIAVEVQGQEHGDAILACAREALKAYNEKQDANLHLKKIVKANHVYLLSNDYYITLEAWDRSTLDEDGSYPVKTYRTQVSYNPNLPQSCAPRCFYPAPVYFHNPYEGY
ncbi:hypothetical protein Tsubulata_030164 [Turnera subulata]|uniref:rRNA N-glycosidase n=1 Tax=Turnera subulata TaxID=218843 RepID=A0A9Q0FYH3_9ROSI|nr:hypothetical protein Tsubulata_030164 [Turnera subulata]